MNNELNMLNANNFEEWIFVHIRTHIHTQARVNFFSCLLLLYSIPLFAQHKIEFILYSISAKPKATFINIYFVFFFLASLWVNILIISLTQTRTHYGFSFSAVIAAYTI